ncbi:hypothetical protein RB628_03650 [Streptomyces sp. ADMS]|uniref:hypothetical protein n=1 Tax=Streptomyces sp. ADMS TaxID=3071415 RepID=UPI00296F19FE|nr:hypothetical protein [Streptomyces sp. ADMS]MDW4904455.1 hypothetical protein [Streptomyces sp. ADMS]
MTGIEARHRAVYAMSSMGRAQSATRLMLQAWTEVANALDDPHADDLQALGKLRESERLAELLADGAFDGPGARLTAQRSQTAGRRKPFDIR